MMWRHAVASAMVAATASAQTVAGPFEKAPPNVNDALKQRVNEFYQDHVDGKYRKAEMLVAEESKDDFYAASKPEMRAFSVGEVIYSDQFTKAKVTVVGKIMMSFLGMSGPQLMDVPFPSYWKLEGGKWSWYAYRDPNRMTPFGKLNGKTAPATANPAEAFATAPNVAAILAGVKVDRVDVPLQKSVGVAEKVNLTNTLSGPVTLSLDAEVYPGLTVKLEPKQLKGGEVAVLSIAPAELKNVSRRGIQILVKPSGQIINLIAHY